MSVERMWAIASMISAIAGLLVSAILVARFYIPYVMKKKAAFMTGIVFFVVMTGLYLIPFPMSGAVAYIIGIIAVFVASMICDRRNISQKVFLSMTIYMFLWISQVIAALPWNLISNFTYAREMMNDQRKQFAWFIVALVLLVAIENVLLFLEIFISEKVYVRKNELMEWRELTLLASPYVAIIAGYWICSFLSDVYNALSNAIRAASESKDPYVDVKAWKNNNAYLIQVKNSFAGKLVLDPQTELPETSKDDKESHGYGLMNMKRITEKYYGTIQLEQREDMVIFTALLMIPE